MPYFWAARKSTRTEHCSNAPELAAAAKAVHEGAWARNLLIEMKQMQSDIRLPFWCDNHGAIAIGNDEVGLTKDNKWMDLDYFHFRDFQREGKIAIG